MPQPRTFALPDDVAAKIDAEVAATGASPQDVVRRHMERENRPVREYSPRYAEHLPAPVPPKSFNDVVRESLEQQTGLMLMRSMQGQNGGAPQASAPALTAEGIASAVATAIEATRRPRRRDDDDEDDDSMRAIERMLAKKAKLKMLKEFAGDDPQTNQFVNDQVAALNARLEALDK